MRNLPSDRPTEPPPDGLAWDSIREALRGLRYGTVTVIVHDGVVIQVERTEKKRLQPGLRRR